jgi:hypothetical protein
MVAAHRLHALGQTDEVRRLLAVDPVVSFCDRFDQGFRVELRGRRDGCRLKPSEIGDDAVELNRLGGGRFGESFLPAAAAVEF